MPYHVLWRMNVRVYIRTYVRTCMHASIHPCMHAYMHTYMPACIHTYHTWYCTHFLQVLAKATAEGEHLGCLNCLLWLVVVSVGSTWCWNHVLSMFSLTHLVAGMFAWFRTPCVWGSLVKRFVFYAVLLLYQWGRQTKLQIIAVFAVLKLRLIRHVQGVKTTNPTK